MNCPEHLKTELKKARLPDWLLETNIFQYGIKDFCYNQVLSEVFIRAFCMEVDKDEQFRDLHLHFGKKSKMQILADEVTAKRANEVLLERGFTQKEIDNMSRN